MTGALGTIIWILDPGFGALSTVNHHGEQEQFRFLTNKFLSLWSLFSKRQA